MCLPSCRSVAAAILAAVEGGILPPGPEALKRKCLQKSRAISAGLDARLYGRQDACRYGKHILRTQPRSGGSVEMRPGQGGFHLTAFCAAA